MLKCANGSAKLGHQLFTSGTNLRKKTLLGNPQLRRQISQGLVKSLITGKTRSFQGVNAVGQTLLKCANGSAKLGPLRGNCIVDNVGHISRGDVRQARDSVVHDLSHVVGRDVWLTRDCVIDDLADVLCCQVGLA